MTPTTSKICGHYGCDTRRALGLKPFCEIDPAPQPTRENVFSNYTEAAEYSRANGGGRIRAGGGYKHGSPRSFSVTLNGA